MAEESGIKAIPLSTEPWVVENMFDHDYDVFFLTIAAEGNFDNLQKFINQVENSEPEKLVINKLKVEKASAASGENVTAGIDIAVYTLSPAAQ
jgi:hypothetical protein